jgi:glycosyltransferase involved in cell wall biosynthesis
MNCLFVDLESAWRGGQNQALLTLRGVRERGHRIELAASEDSELARRASALGISVHTVGGRGQRIRMAMLLRRLLRAGKFDVIHINEPHSLTAAWLAGAHHIVPTVISRRVGYRLQTNALSLRRYRAASRILANSRWVAAQVIAAGISPERVEVVYEGVEIPPKPSLETIERARARWKIDKSELLLGCVGALLPDKGQEWLIRALATLRKDFPRCRLLLAGEGPCRERLERLTRELRLENAVIFAGFVKDVENVYPALDLFLLPSLFEAFNNSLLAAMSYELPAVVFAKGALPEIVEQEKSGLLVSGLEVQEIAGAAARLLNDRNFSKRLGEAARQRVENSFSANQMVKKTVDAYERVIADARLRASTGI